MQRQQKQISQNCEWRTHDSLLPRKQKKALAGRDLYQMQSLHPGTCPASQVFGTL